MTTSTATLARMLEATKPVPWIHATPSLRQHRRNASYAFAGIRLAFIEAYGRCVECAADDAARSAGAHLSFDAARDRALLRRDVNEILETISLETLL